MNISTSDLSDQFESLVQVAEPLFQNYGGIRSFEGKIATLRVFEDNSLVREEVETDGQGRILVVDGGGSLQCSLVGDQVAQLAHHHGWPGLVVNGCIRDSSEVAQIPIGVKALNTIPRKSVKKGIGDRQVTVHFAGLSFQPDHYLYADEDGILIADRDLLAQT